MKINPLDQVHSLHQTGTVGRQKANEGDFKAVLNRVLEPKSAARPESPAVFAVQDPRVACESAKDRVYHGVERMLNALERYQHLLADTQASLRAVEPALRQVKQEAATLEPILAEMAQDDPFRATLGEALSMAATEIARFEGGKYVPVSY